MVLSNDFFLFGVTGAGVRTEVRGRRSE